MRYVRKTAPKSIEELNKMLKEVNSDYVVEMVDDGEIVMRHRGDCD